MSSVNKVILIGHLGKDPEIRNIEGGAKVASFSLATNENYMGKDGKKVEQTEWHNIILWNKLADLAEQFLKKGNQVYLEGRIKTRSWDDKDGIKRYITEIWGDNMRFLGRPANETPPPPAPMSATHENGQKESAPVVGEDDSDLPF